MKPWHSPKILEKKNNFLDLMLLDKNPCLTVLSRKDLTTKVEDPLLEDDESMSTTSKCISTTSNI